MAQDVSGIVSSSIPTHENEMDPRMMQTDAPMRPRANLQHLRMLAFSSIIGRFLLELFTMYMYNMYPRTLVVCDVLSVAGTTLLCLTAVYIGYRLEQFRSVIRMLVAATILLVFAQALDVAHSMYPPDLRPPFFQTGGGYDVLKTFTGLAGVMFLLMGLYEGVLSGSAIERQLEEDRRGLIGAARERARAEIALRESEGRFRRVLENSKDVIFELNLITREYVYLSPSSETLSGFTPDEIRAMGPQGMTERVHPDDREFRASHFRRALEAYPNQRQPSVEYRWRVKSGEYRWASDSWNTVRDEHGQPIAIIGTTRDVTPIKMAEQALRESEALHRALLNAIPDLMYLLYEDGSVLDLRQTSPLTGLETEEARTRLGKAAEVLPGELGRQAMMYYRRALNTGQVQVLDFVHTVQGEKRYVEARFVACEPGEVLVILRDNTERNRLEQEVLDVSTQEQRRIGRDLHDGLGQHLTGILCLSMGMVNSLSEKTLPEADDATEITHLVKQAIAQTRSLARGLSPVMETHGLPTALEELARRSRDVFKVACVLDAFKYVPHRSRVVEEQLFRIAQESVSNAIKHAKAEQIVITLETHRGRTTLAIRDDGVGMPDEAHRGKGMGLRNMEYRARMIGAVLAFEANPSGGTRVVCSVEDDQTA